MLRDQLARRIVEDMDIIWLICAQDMLLASSIPCKMQRGLGWDQSWSDVS